MIITNARHALDAVKKSTDYKSSRRKQSDIKAAEKKVADAKAAHEKAAGLLKTEYEALHKDTDAYVKLRGHLIGEENELGNKLGLRNDETYHAELQTDDKDIPAGTRPWRGSASATPRAGGSPLSPAPGTPGMMQGGGNMAATENAMQGVASGAAELGDAVVRNAETVASTLAQQVARVDAITRIVERNNTDIPASV